MRIEFKEFKKYSKSMGFRNQKEFRNHVYTKRNERLKYRKEEEKLDTYYSLKPNARSIMRDADFSAQLETFAWAVAIWSNVVPQSKKATIVHSCKLEANTVRYSGAGHYSMLYYDISYYRAGDRLILKNFFRGKHQRIEIRLPMNWRKFTSSHNGLLRHELGYLGYGGILKRFTYDSTSNSFKCVGVAIELDDPIETGKKYWEHGLTVKDCIRERENKAEAYRKEQIFKAQSLKASRKQRLISRLCNNIRVTFQDALDSGNCLQGVKNFVEHNFKERMPEFYGNQFVNNRAILLGELKNANYSSNTKRVIDYVCMMVTQLTE